MPPVRGGLPKRRKPRSPQQLEGYALLLRKNMTRAEARLWSVLRKKQRTWQHKFAPQVPVNGYIPDFYCESLKLAVEIDGKVHRRKDVKRNDKIRTRRLNKNGITVIRFRNDQVFSMLHVIMDILSRAAQSPSSQS